jgi:hypothetical protein
MNDKLKGTFSKQMTSETKFRIRNAKTQTRQTWKWDVVLNKVDKQRSKQHRWHLLDPCWDSQNWTTKGTQTVSSKHCGRRSRRSEKVKKKTRWRNTGRNWHYTLNLLAKQTQVVPERSGKTTNTISMNVHESVIIS